MAAMTYPVGARNRGWLWEHRVVVTAVCVGVIVSGVTLVGSGFMPFSVDLLLVVANVAALLVLVVLVLLWLSTTASHLPPHAEPIF